MNKNFNFFIDFFKRNKDSFIFQVIICAAIFLFINLKDIYFYFINPVVPGWDSMGHVSIGIKYYEEIFPKTWGYLTNWYSGISFPQFYPPLLFWLVSFVVFITGLSYIFTIKIFAIFSLIGICAVLILMCRYLFGNTISSWIAVVFSALTISISYDKFDAIMGVNIKSVTQSGLIPYVFSFFFLILFLYFLLKNNFSNRHIVISSAVLSVVLLSNIHNVPVALIIMFIMCLIHLVTNPNNKIRVLIYYFSVGILSLSLSLFWYLPMLHDYQYLTSINNSSRYYIVKTFFQLVAPIFMISWFFGFRSNREYKQNIKDNVYIIFFNIFTAVIFIVTILSPADLFKNLTLHVSRWTPAIFILFVPFMVNVFNNILKNKIDWKRDILLIVSVASISIYFFLGLTNKFHLDYPVDGFRTSDIVEYLSGDAENFNNIIMVEKTSNDYIKLGLAPSVLLESELGVNNFNSAWGILRESSMSSLFFTPIKNMLAPEQETWGIETYLNAYTKDDDIKTVISRVNFLGIDKIILSTELAIKQISESEDVSLEKDFGFWKIFDSKQEIKRISIPKNKPVLLFTDLILKDRSLNDLNWVRFQELIIENNEFDNITFVKNKTNIDQEDLSLFDLIVLEDYKYIDEDVAFNNLKLFTENGKIIAIKSADRLFDRLNDLSLETQNIFIVNRPPNVLSTENILGERVQKIFDLIKYNNSKMDVEISIDGQISNNAVRVDFSDNVDEYVPVLIKSTYSSMFKSSNNGPVYLATPSFILTYENNDFTLDFKASKSVYLGYMLSVMAFILLAYIYFKNS